MCPICGQGVSDESRATPIDKSLFHNDCLNRKHKQAQAENKKLTFIWKGGYCAAVTMIPIERI